MTTFDLAVAFQYAGKNRDRLDRMVRASRKSLAEHIASLHAAVDSGDDVTAHLCVHSMKSVAAYIGAAELHESACAAENHANARDMDGLRGMVPVLASRVTDVLRAIDSADWNALNGL